MKADYAEVNGLRMYYEIHGEGDTLVLIHGGGSTINSSFGNIIPFLSNHFRLVAVELQAHGHSGDRDLPVTFEQDADDVAALLKEIGEKDAVIFGFSNGGTTALQLAIRHPEMVRKLVLASAASKRSGLFDGFFEMMKNVSLDNMPPELKEDYLKIPGNTQDGLKNMHDKDAQRMMQFRDIPLALVARITSPALVINGDKDVTTVEHALELSRLIEGSRLLILPSDHGSYIGELCSRVKTSSMCESVAGLIKEFLTAE